MPDPIIRFDRRELEACLPDEGDYSAFVCSVCKRTAASGNTTIQVVYEVTGVAPEWDRVSEYFVVSCPNQRALAISQRRLFSLCQACGLSPAVGEEINLRHLVGLGIEIRLGHEVYEQRKRLRVLRHRSRS
ncbi:MAG: DUF669 domain-containing protein [Thermoanaerobaculaceae bacterium]|jgi:hypothetical protein|nr:DUF669 domain-containing protein [Thermoanaerobaculaceae bacterium]